MHRIIALCLFALMANPLSAQSLVGKWDCEGRDGNDFAIRTLQQYRANGLFYHLANVAIGIGGSRMDTSIVLRGSWKLKGQYIEEEFRSGRLRSISMNDQDISKTEVGRRMARDLPERMFGPRKKSRSKIRFVSNNRFEMLGRVKGTCNRRQ